MASRVSLWKSVYVRLILIAGSVVLMASILFNRCDYLFDSITLRDHNGIQRDCDRRIESMNEMNRELSARLAGLQEELRVTAEERDSLKQDKAQLLFMVKKLEQQSGRFSSPGKEGSPGKKIVRSWLVRIAELRNAQVPDDAPSINGYINEVNEVVRGLKEDFSEDPFIMGIGYSKTSSPVKNGIRSAHKKLDEITEHLSSSYSPGVEE